MRYLIIFLLSFLLTGLFFASCEMTEKTTLTEAPVSDPVLAGEEDEELVGAISIASDGTVVEQWVKPVIWDGKSPIESAVVYRFDNVEELRKALAITSPWRLECYDKTLAARAESEKKTKISPELSTVFFGASWVREDSPGILTGYGGVTTWGTWSGTLRHYIRVEWDKNNKLFWVEQHDTWTDGQPKATELYRQPYCPISSMWVDADIWLNDIKEFDSHDTGSCD